MSCVSLDFVTRLRFYRKKEIRDQLKGMEKEDYENAGNEAAVVRGRTRRIVKVAHVVSSSSFPIFDLVVIVVVVVVVISN